MRRLAEVESEVSAIRSRMGKGSYFTEQEINLVQLIRTMENKLDKTSTKIAETIHIKHAYEAIRDKLIGVSSFILYQTTEVNASRIPENKIAKTTLCFKIGKCVQKLSSLCS